MGIARITIELPAELVERAKAANVALDDVTAEVIELVEKRIEKQEAVQNLLEIMDEFAQIPDDEKPSEQEIVEIVREVRREQAAQRDANPNT
jgi:hypothetical protein